MADVATLSFAEKHSASLGVKYISLKDKFLTETGVLFDKEEVKNTPTAKVLSLYKERLDGPLFDYSFAKSTGNLRRHRIEETIRESAIDMLAKKMKGRSGKADFMTLVIRAVMGVIAVIAILLSASYTTEYLSKTQDMWRAVSLSWSMIIFAVVSFDVIFMFWRPKQHALAVVFSIVWIVVTVFSMFSTVSVNFDRYEELLETYAEEVVSVVAAERLSATLLDAIEAKRNSNEMLASSVAEYSKSENVSAWYLSQMMDKVSAAEKELAEMEASLLSSVETASESPHVERKKTIFDSIEDMFGIKAAKAHFLVNLLPAVFVDIIAPFASAVAIFLGRKKHDEEGL